MAGNTLTNVLDKILAGGLASFREAAVMPRLVNTDYGSEARQKGATIDVPVPVAQSVSDVTPAPTYTSAAGNSPGLVQIQLNRWRHTDFFLTDKEMAEIDRNRHFFPMQAAEAARALANDVDANIHAEYKSVWGYVGTAAVVPFSTVATATDARKVLNEQLAPMGMRNIVMDPTAEGQALQLSAYSDVEKTQDRPVKIEGEIGRKFGIDHFMSQNVVTHTTGTAVSVVVGSTTTAGSSVLNVKAGSSTGVGTIKLGDVFTVAGDTQTYVVRTSADTTLVSALTNVEISISPALKVTASTNDKLTFKATHVVNLAFHRNAFTWASRPLMDVGGAVAQQSVMTDPLTGVTMRLEVLRQSKQTAFDFDILYGAKNIRPEFAARVAG